MDTGDWPQVVIDFPDWSTAEDTAADVLRPVLNSAEENGLIHRWFFIRKAPSWRLRYEPADSSAQPYLARTLHRATAAGRLTGWRTGIYEPETVAFGGAAGMRIAHELFHHDSRRILDRLARPTADLGRRELGVLLGSVLMRAAGLDWYEQGDVWTRVARHRPAEPEHTPSPALTTAVRKLMTVDVGPSSGLLSEGGPLVGIAPWIAAFERAGRQLADLASRGTLERGLRAVLTHHVIFHWNRLGLPYADQHTLATLTSEVVMGNPHGGASTGGKGGDAPNVPDVSTHTAQEPDLTDTAARLRNALVDRLFEDGAVHSERVEAALRVVPRHVFVPDVPLEQAYADEAVYTKHDDTGVSISAASQPTIVAMMLEQLQPQPGQRVLELGAGTGYNAALLAQMVGDEGEVVTIDVDDDIVTGARNGLAAAGVQNVRVLLADGALGHAASAPYDRITATVGAGDLPLPWLDQLAPDGRLVVPLRLRGSVSRSIAFEHDNGRWLGRTSEMCTFMPLRGIADDARRIVPLTSDGSVCLHANREQTVDASLLNGVLDTPRHQAWTDVLMRGDESFEWLDLWLTCVMDNALSRMPVERSAIDEGLVTPQFGWGAMAVADKGDLAYLTIRPRTTDSGNGAGRMFEIGVIGHGPTGDVLTDRVADAIRTWDREYRSRAVQFEIQPMKSAAPTEPVPGRFVFDRPNTRLTIAWQ